MSIKSVFSIKDLENLSGVKAHTIRIWEKRYQLFEPDRSDTNIRLYSSQELVKLLNVAFLNNNGLKVSKIAALEEAEIRENVLHILNTNNALDHYCNNLKIAMMNFDKQLFNQTYQTLVNQKPFRHIFFEVFGKLLYEIGLLWQTNTIKPAHENFISTLITQKLLLQIENLPSIDKQERAYVLFLPQNEIHHIGLLYIYYELLLAGNYCLFLGTNVQKEDLNSFTQSFQNVHFVSYFTVEPQQQDLQNYFEEIQQNILRPNQDYFHVLGRKLKELKPNFNLPNVKFYYEIKDFVNTL